MLRFLRRLLVATASLCAVGAAPAGATPVVLPPAPLHTERPGAAGLDPAGAVAPGGEAVVAWRNRVSPYESFLSVRRRTAAGVWGAEERVGQIHPWQYNDVSVAIDPAGAATVVWTMTGEGQGPSGQTVTSTGVWAVHAGKGEPFGTPGQLGFDEHSLGNRPTVTQATASGEVLVAWHEGDNAVHAVARSASGVWGAENVVTGPGAEHHSGGVRLAAAPSGRAVIGWRDETASHARALLSVRPAGGTFGPAQIVGEGVERTPSVEPAITADGRAVAVETKWGTMDTTTSTLWTLGASATAFTLRQTLPESVQIPEAVVLDQAGAGYIVGTQWGFTDSEDQTWRIALPLTASGALGTPIPVATVAEVGEQLAAGFDAQGVLQLAWRLEHDRNAEAYDAEILARSVSPGGTVSPIRSIARANSLLYAHSVAAGGARPLVLFTLGWYGMGDVFAEPLSSPTAQPEPVPATTTPSPALDPLPLTPVPSTDPASATPPVKFMAPAPATPQAPSSPGATPQAPAAPTPAAPTPTQSRCVVPRLTGLKYATAKQRLARAGCQARIVRRVNRARALIVTKQSPAEGTRSAGYVVRLVLSR